MASEVPFSSLQNKNEYPVHSGIDSMHGKVGNYNAEIPKMMQPISDSSIATEKTSKPPNSTILSNFFQRGRDYKQFDDPNNKTTCQTIDNTFSRNKQEYIWNKRPTDKPLPHKTFYKKHIAAFPNNVIVKSHSNRNLLISQKVKEIPAEITLGRRFEVLADNSDSDNEAMPPSINKICMDIAKYIPYPYLKSWFPKNKLKQCFQTLMDLENLTPELCSLNPKTLDPLQLQNYQRQIPIAVYQLHYLHYVCLVEWFQEEAHCQVKRGDCGISPWEAYSDPIRNRHWVTKNYGAILQKTLHVLTLREELKAVYRKECDVLSPLLPLWLLQKWKPKRVLFWCSGWGGSLVACVAYLKRQQQDLSLLVTEHLQRVVAIDASKKVVDSYAAMTQYYSSLAELSGSQDNLWRFEHGAFEDSSCSLDNEELFDLAFSCPPYFIVEQYSSDPEQSSQRYSSLKEWLEKFLFVSVKKTWEHLKIEGILAIHFNDVWWKNSSGDAAVLRLAQPLHDFMDTNYANQSEYLGTWGFRADIHKRSHQPLFVWQKKKISK
jgi:hypothetical protein